MRGEVVTSFRFGLGLPKHGMYTWNPINYAWAIATYEAQSMFHGADSVCIQ